jgi:RNA polymerase sigma-70 factor (ECF subfamily)
VILVRGLKHALPRHRHCLDEALVEDSVQAALVRILKGLCSFEGRSRFLTWAQAVAVHLALIEARRVRWANVSLQELTGDTDFVPPSLVDHQASPETQATQRKLLEAIHRIIHEQLTERQRQVLIAEERGMSLQEVAKRMGTSRGAVYKALYDARQRLRKSLEATGVSAEDIRSAFDL